MSWCSVFVARDLTFTDLDLDGNEVCPMDFFLGGLGLVGWLVGHFWVDWVEFGGAWWGCYS